MSELKIPLFPGRSRTAREVLGVAAVLWVVRGLLAAPDSPGLVWRWCYSILVLTTPWLVGVLGKDRKLLWITRGLAWLVCSIYLVLLLLIWVMPKDEHNWPDWPDDTPIRAFEAYERSERAQELLIGAVIVLEAVGVALVPQAEGMEE